MGRPPRSAKAKAKASASSAALTSCDGRASSLKKDTNDDATKDIVDEQTTAESGQKKPCNADEPIKDKAQDATPNDSEKEKEQNDGHDSNPNVTDGPKIDEALEESTLETPHVGKSEAPSTETENDDHDKEASDPNGTEAAASESTANDDDVAKAKSDAETENERCDSNNDDGANENQVEASPEEEPEGQECGAETEEALKQEEDEKQEGDTNPESDSAVLEKGTGSKEDTTPEGDAKTSVDIKLADAVKSENDNQLEDAVKSEGDVKLKDDAKLKDETKSEGEGEAKTGGTSNLDDSVKPEETKDEKEEKSSEGTVEQPTTEENEEEEIWDIVRAFTAKERANKKQRKMCMGDKCKAIAVVEWSSNLEPDNPYYYCEPCQEEEFGGWPEGFEIPNDVHESPKKGKKKKDKATKTPSPPKSKKQEQDAENSKKDSPSVDEKAQSPTKEQSSAGQDEKSNAVDLQPSRAEDANNLSVNNDATQKEGESGEEEDDWVIEKAFTVAELKKARAQKCNTPDCSLLACVKWVREGCKETWYTCVDCQELDFGGWPPEDETPAMTAQQIEVISLRCSHQDDPKMPKPRLASTSSPGSTSAALGANSVTPPPGAFVPTSVKQISNEGPVGVTPSPMVVGAHVVQNNAKPKKPSAKLTELHKKWQAEAEKVGGKGARVICSKPEAKKVIRDILFERFGPMNVTDIYTSLKATVPSAILRVCLDEMIPEDALKDGFNDSDDENGESKKKKKKKSNADPSLASDPYKSCVLLKEGRSLSNNLYFLDQAKLDNNGNGLEPEQRNQLEADFAQAKAEELELNQKLQALSTQTAKLLSEPTNEDMEAQLEQSAAAVSDLTGKVESYRELKVHEASRKKTKRGIEYFASVWRSRKRMCSDFLISMEECTDGTVSAKKCLSGDGQIELDGDEAVLKAVVEYGKRKRQQASIMSRMSNKRPKMSHGNGQGSNAGLVMSDTDFVGVKLDNSGNIARVYLEDEKK